MANLKSERAHEKLRKKYGIQRKTTSDNNDIGKQSDSAPSTRTDETVKTKSERAHEKLREKYGISNTMSKTDFDTETKNAYTAVKNKANTINTRASNLTEDEREARIKEIHSEMRVINDTLTGLGRAANYGGQSDWYKTKSEEAKKRKAELSEELKTLERVGTFTASELKQFEIDDAKSKKAALPAYNPTARVAPQQVDAFKESVNAHSEIDKKIDTLEHEKNLYDDIVKFGDVVHEDDFGGQFRANYRSSDLSREADKAMSRYIAAPTEENKQIAYAYDAFSKAYMQNNEKALDDENVRASWLTKSAAGYLPQFRDTFVPELLGGAVGGLLGGTAGASVGAGMASYSQMYDVIRGSVYRTLLAEGVDEEIALKAAEDEAVISSLIEGGETALSWVLTGGTKALSAIGNAAKKGVAKGSTNVATGLVAKMASKATGRAATKAARAATRPLWEKGLRAAGGIVGNAFTEYGEEFAQEAVSTANKERALSGTDTGLIRGAGKVISDAVTGKNPEALNRMHEAGAEGFKIGLMFGGGQTVVNNAIAHYFNAKTINEQNEELDKIRSDDLTLTSFIEKGKASGKGTIAEKIATEVETAREKGKVVTRDQARRLVEATKDEMRATGNVNTDQTVSAEHQTAESDTLEKAAREVVAERNRKGTLLYERLEALSRNNEQIMAEDVKKATGLGNEGAKLIAEITNKEGKSFSQAEKTVKTAYMVGFTNVNSSEVSFATETQINAFTAGKKDRAMQDLSAIEKAKNATVYEGVFTENEHTKNFTKAERTMISTFAKSFGMDVSAVDKIIANVVNGRKYEANAEHQDGQMRISSTAEKVISEIVLHEGGHRMRQLAPTEFGVLMDALYERAEGRSVNLGVPQGLIFDSIKAEHDNAGITMNTSGYMEEFAVRELETIFGSAEEFNKWYAEISGNQQVKTAWQKFMDFVAELIEDIKRIVAEVKMSKEEKAEAKKTLTELEHIKELYADAYKAAENAVAERTKEFQSAEKGNVQKNVNTDSNKNFDLKLPEMENDEDWKRLNTKKRFYSQLDNWDGETIGFSFVLGTTSKALIDAEVPNKQIRWDASKIKTLLGKHNGMTIETVKQIPNLLENPVVVIDSKQNENSRLIMGDLHDANGKLVTVVLLLTPTSKKGNQLDVIKVSSAQGRGHIASLFRNEDGSDVKIRFVDKKRIQSWLNVNRLQLPLHSFNLDSNNIISQTQENVNSKFSLKGTSDISTKDRKELLDIIEHLKGEFELTKFAKADQKKLAKMTRDILKEYNSQADFDETFKAIDELYQYMANGEDGHSPVWEDVYDRAYTVSQEIIENALVVDDYTYREYKSLREYLRNTPMKFDDRYDSVPTSYESFNDFRKQNMGRLKFTKDGMPISSVYQELSNLYPEFFDADEQINTADQLERIIDVFDEIQPTEVNPFDNQIQQVSMYLANDLTSRFFDIPQAKPTFADKAEKRVVDARIAGAKKVEAVRQQKDAKIQKLIESQKEKTKKQIDKLRQQRDIKVKKEQEKRRAAVSKMSESQKARVLRARIMRHTSDLSKKLLKPTDNQHIPHELQGAVATLLDSINLESNYTYDPESHSYKKNDEGLPAKRTKAFEELRSLYKNIESSVDKTQAFIELKEVFRKIAKDNKYGLTLAPELIDLAAENSMNIFDEVVRFSNKKIADMTSEELTKIYNAIRLIEHSIATANKMFAIKKWESLTETAKAFEKSVATRRPKHALMKSHYTLDIENSLTFLSHFGEAGLELYQALRNAQDNETMMIKELAEVTQSIVSLEEVQNAEKDIYEFTTAEGEKLTLSKAHIMDIYLLYNRKQGRKHLLYDPKSEHFGNGIHQPEIKSKHIRRDAESIRLTKADLENIISKLSSSDKAIADKMQKTTLMLAEWGNKACMEVFGYEKFNDRDYWTIKSSPEGTNQTVEKNKDAVRSIKNMSSAKPTDDKATNALDIDGVFDLFNQHASEMIRYSAWLGIMEDATKLYNYTFREENGSKKKKTFQSMLEKYGGEGGSKYYLNLLTDIQNGIGILPDTATEQFYTKLYGTAAKAKVAYKLTVVAQQPMAIVRATTVLNPLSIIKAIGKGGVSSLPWAYSKVKNVVTKGSTNVAEWYGGWQRALKYAPVATRKAISGYEINANSSGLKSVLYKPETTKGKVIDFAKESPLWAAGKADEITWGILWNACEFETNKNNSYETGNEAYYKAVAKLFTKVIDETQVVDGVLQRSQMMRSSSGWIKPLTTFKGEPTMSLNGVIRAYDKLRYETNPAKRGKAIKNFSRTVVVFLFSAVFTAFARSLAVGVTGDDDEEFWEKFWKSFSGIQGDEGTWFDYVKNMGLKSDVVNNINPLSWLPVASEIMSALQGYDVERLDVASIGDFVNAATTFINSFDDENKYKAGYATRNLLLKIVEFTGYSPYNLVRDIEGAIRTSRVETNDIRGLYDMEKWRTKPASNVSTYVDILYRAYTTDKKDYEYIYNDMLKSGVDAEKIQSGMESRMKKAEGVTKASDLSKRYMSPLDEKKYDNSLKKIQSSKVWKSATSTQRKEAETELYDFLTSTSEAMEKTRAEARAYGVDETEYTLWQLAAEMSNDKTASMNAKEKAAAIEMLDLSNSELAYFYNTETGDKAYAAGIDMKNFAKFKAAVSGLKGDDKKAKVDAFADRYARDYKEYLFFMGTEYSSYKKRNDYIKYFGK